MRKPSKWVYIFGFMPGLGQMMLGLMNRGLQFMILFWGIIFLATSTFDTLTIFLPLLIFYAYFDALQCYREILETGSAKDGKLFQWEFFQDKKKWIGWGLIAFGSLSFLRLVIGYLPFNIYFQDFQQGVVTLAFIALGYKLLRGEKENQPENVATPIQIETYTQESGDQ